MGDDLGPPVVGGNSGSADMALIIGGSVATNTQVASLGGRLFAIRGEVTTTASPASTAGITKYAANTTRSFKATAYMLTLGGVALSGRYQRTGLSPQTGDYDALGFPIGLRYDGQDDGMYTAAPIDYSGTDKVTVSTPAYKASDAATGVVYEHGANADFGAGGWYLAAPVGASSASVQTGPVGARVYTNYTGLPAPAGYVFTAGVNNAAVGAAQVSLRANGAPATGFPTINGGAVGNFGNFVNYEGARGDASLRFNGMVLGEFQWGDTTALSADRLAVCPPLAGAMTMDQMDWVHRCMIVPAAYAPAAREMAAAFGPSSQGMFEDGLGSGKAPSHFISVGLVDRSFADMIADPEKLVADCAKLGMEVPLAFATELLAACDISDEEGATACARLGVERWSVREP